MCTQLDDGVELPVEEKAVDRSPTLMELLDPLTADSSLGWYSNVFDLVRFARCVFDGDQVNT
jgi:hypothetical protein